MLLLECLTKFMGCKKLAYHDFENTTFLRVVKCAEPKIFGVSWYDYGARMYDPSLGRWTTPDPLAELFKSKTPFGYVSNNPISRIDPNGMADTDMYGRNKFDENGMYIAPMDRQAAGDGFEGGQTKKNSNSSSKDRDSKGGDNNTSGDDPSNNGSDKTQTGGGIIDFLSRVFYHSIFDEEVMPDGKVAIIVPEVTPYVAVSVGKETNESVPLSGWGSLTLTPKSLYLSVGGDITIGTPAISTKTSVSLSTGVFIGPKSGIEGSGFGYSGGSVIGFNRGYSVNSYQNWKPVVGTTNTYGVTIGNTLIYGSANYGYTWKIAKW